MQNWDEKRVPHKSFLKGGLAFHFHLRHAFIEKNRLTTKVHGYRPKERATKMHSYASTRERSKTDNWRKTGVLHRGKTSQDISNATHGVGNRRLLMTVYDWLKQVNIETEIYALCDRLFDVRTKVQSISYAILRRKYVAKPHTEQKQNDLPPVALGP